MIHHTPENSSKIDNQLQKQRKSAQSVAFLGGAKGAPRQEFGALNYATSQGIGAAKEDTKGCLSLWLAGAQ